MKITIDAHEVIFNGSKLPAYARVYCNQQFINDEDQTVLEGSVESQNYIKQVSVSNSAGIATIAPFSGANQLDSNVDENGVVLSTYALTLHDANGKLLEVVYPTLFIPRTPTTTSWDDIAMYGELPHQTMRYDYYTKAEIDRTRADYQSLAPKASTVQIGVTKLSLTPLDLNNPIAVADNDTRLPVNIATYGDVISDAVDAIGSDEIVLQITRPVAVDANTTVPKNITIDIQGEGLIIVSNGITLTIGNMKDPGSRKIFSGAGSIRFANGAVDRMNVTWFVGAEDNVDVTAAMNQMLASAEANEGGIIYLPDGLWLTQGGHIQPSGTVIRGAGTFASAALTDKHTILRLTQNSTSMFTVGELVEGFRFFDITLDGDGQSDSQAILCEGEYPNSSGNLACENVTFLKFTDAFRIHSLPNIVSAWQMAQVAFKNCTFTLNAHSAIRCNTVNVLLSVDTTNFGVLDDGWACYFENVASATFFNCEFAGLSGQAACVGGIPGPTMAEGVFYLGGGHGPINVYGGQDEGFRYYIYNDASDISSVINLYGTEVQSVIQLNESCVLNLYGSTHLSKSIKDGVNSASRVAAYGCIVDDRDLCGNVVSPPVLTEFVGGTVLTIEQNSVDGRFTQRLPARFLSPAALDGNPTTPLAMLGAYTAVAENKDLLWLGRTDIDGEKLYGYTFRRNYGNGRLEIEGDQAGFEGLDFNGDVRATQFSMSEATALATTGFVTMDCSLSNVYTLTPTGNVSIDAANIVAGKKYYLVILTSGVTSRSVAFTTGFKTTGVLSTGTVSGKYFVIEFFSPDTSNVLELRRTVAL